MTYGAAQRGHLPDQTEQRQRAPSDQRRLVPASPTGSRLVTELQRAVGNAAVVGVLANRPMVSQAVPLMVSRRCEDPSAYPSCAEPDVRRGLTRIYRASAIDPDLPLAEEIMTEVVMATAPGATTDQVAAAQTRAGEIAGLEVVTDDGETLDVPALLHRLDQGFESAAGELGVDLSFGLGRAVGLLARNGASYLGGAFVPDPGADARAVAKLDLTLQSLWDATRNGEDLLTLEMEGTIERLLDLRFRFAAAATVEERAGIGAEISGVARRALLLDRVYSDLGGADGEALHLLATDEAMSEIAVAAAQSESEGVTARALGDPASLLGIEPVAFETLTDDTMLGEQSVLPEEALPQRTDEADEQFGSELLSRIQTQARGLKDLHDAVLPPDPSYSVDELAQVHRRWHSLFSNAQERHEIGPEVAYAMAGQVYQLMGTDTGDAFVSVEQGFARAMLMPVIVKMFQMPRFVPNPGGDFAAEVAEIGPRRRAPEVTGSASSPEFSFAELYGPGSTSVAGEVSSREQTATEQFRTTSDWFTAFAERPGPHQLGGIPVVGVRPTTPEEGWTYLVNVVDPMRFDSEQPAIVEKEQKTVPPEVVRYLLARRQATRTLTDSHRARAGGRALGGPGTRRSIEQTEGVVAERYIEGEDAQLSDTAQRLQTVRDAQAETLGIDLEGTSESARRAVSVLVGELRGYLDAYFGEHQDDGYRIAAILAIAATEHGIGEKFRAFTDAAQLGEMVASAVGLGAGLGLLRSLGPIGRIASAGIGGYLQAQGVSDLTAAMSIAAFLKQACGASSFSDARAWALVASGVADDIASLLENALTGPLADTAGRLAAGPGTPRAVADAMEPLLSADPTARRQMVAEVDAELASIDAGSGAQGRSADSPERGALAALRDSLLGRSSIESAEAAERAIPATRFEPDHLDLFFTGPRTRTAADRGAMRAALGGVDVPIAENTGLSGSTVRVHYGEDGVRVEYGPAAEPRHIRAHAEVARQLKRWDGVLGGLRALLGRVRALITGHPAYVPGSRAFEARLEVQKLRGIIGDVETRLARMDARADELTRNPGEASEAPERARLEAELREAVDQLDEHQRDVDSYEQGRGFVAAESGSAAPASWPRQTVTPRRVHGRWVGFPDTVPQGVVLEFPDGAKVWRTGRGTIAIESELAAGPGRAGHERTLPARGGYADPGYQQALYELAHSQGQGTGHESPYGIQLAPQVVNQRLQRYGIEEFLYNVRDHTPLPEGTRFHIVTDTGAVTGTRRLKDIEYRVDVTMDGVRRRLLGFTIAVTGPIGDPHCAVVAPWVSSSEHPAMQDLADTLLHDVDMSSASRAIQSHLDRDDAWANVSFGTGD